MTYPSLVECKQFCYKQTKPQLFTDVKYFLTQNFTFVFMGDFSGLFGLLYGRLMGYKPSPYNAQNS